MNQLSLYLRGDTFLQEYACFELLYGARCDVVAEGDTRGHILGAYPLPKGSSLANCKRRKLPSLQNAHHD
jgi:hypothetical protein